MISMLRSFEVFKDIFNPGEDMVGRDVIMRAGIVEEITDEGGDIWFCNTKHGCYPFTTMLSCCKT
jgi:hypothetical protein